MVTLTLRGNWRPFGARSCVDLRLRRAGATSHNGPALFNGPALSYGAELIRRSERSDPAALWNPGESAPA